MMKKKCLAVFTAIIMLISCFAGRIVSATSSAEDDIHGTVAELTKSTFDTYVATNGNATDRTALLAAVNTAISPYTATIASDDHYFIYHAVDGCYDEAEINQIVIPGHDGYVSAVFSIANSSGASVGTIGAVAKIPHNEENLGTLTTSTASDFTISGTTVTAYNGTAEKVIIPDGVTNINALASDGKIVSAKVLIIPASVTKINNAAFRCYATGASGATPGTLTGGWSSLKAVEINGGNTIVGENVFVRDYNLKYLKLPSSPGKGYLDYQCFGYCFALENVIMGAGMPLKGNVFAYTPVRSFYEGQKTTVTAGEYYSYKNPTFSGGTRSIMTYANQQSATLTRAATLAQAVADNLSFNNGTDTASSIRDAITAAYSDKTVTTEITADWNDTFTSSGGNISGTLTLTQGAYTVPIEYSYNTFAGLSDLSVEGYTISPAFNSQTYSYTLGVLGTTDSIMINATPAAGATLDFTNGSYALSDGDNVFTIHSTLPSGTVLTYTLTVTRLPYPAATIDSITEAFEQYVTNKGNKTDPDALLAYINTVIAPASVSYATDGIYIRHAVDGVYDENDDGYSVDIPGHDGSVAVNLNIYNENGLLTAYYGHLVPIPHNTENLGILTSDIFNEEDALMGDGNFKLDSDGNIIGYTGDAEKIIIPGSFSGKINWNGTVTNKDDVIAVVIGGSQTSAMTLDINNYAFSGWGSLRAVELPRKINGRIGQFAFAYNPVLKYVDTPASIAGSNGSGYGTFENEAFRECPVLENINANNLNTRMTTGQLWSLIYSGTSVRDYFYEGWFQFGNSGSTANIASAPAFSEGTQNILAVAANSGQGLTPTFTRAVTMAQEKADTLTVTASNASSALSAITSAYSAKLSGVTTTWADDSYNTLLLTYGNYTVPVFCNRVSYNTSILLTMEIPNSFRTIAPAGLRFSYTVDGLQTLVADSGVANVQLGTLIAPTDTISAGFTHFDMNLAGSVYLDIPTVYQNGNTVSAVLSNILSTNYTREFSAVAYAKITYVDGMVRYVYADNCATARPADVAAQALKTASDANEITYLESIVDAATVYTANYIDTTYSASDTAAYTMRNSILSTENGTANASVYTGSTYCINESNFLTYKAKLGSLPEGSKILFQRGGTYRVGSIAISHNNLYFGAYGSGDKPVLLGSERNYANSTWAKLTGNVWYVNNISTLSDNDAGIVIFDDGKKAGTKVSALANVKNDGDFWYDQSNDRLYLASSANPATLWGSIEIGMNQHIFDINGKSGITIDNFNLRYTGGHGISLIGVSNIAVTNCEIAYIGGSYMTHVDSNSTTRYGNGVEIWCKGNNVTVDNCWIHQIFDSGLTHQGTATGSSLFTQSNIAFTNNLIEYCALASIEYWSSASGNSSTFNEFGNLTYSGNICRFAGYGLGTQGMVRTGWHLYTSTAALNHMLDGATFEVNGNTFDTARGGLLKIAGSHYVSCIPTLSGNTYIQNFDGILGILPTEFNSDGSVKSYTTYNFDSAAAQTIASKFKDTSATVRGY